jgi:hypothetical protein
MIVRIAPCLWRTNDVLSCVREVGCAYVVGMFVISFSYSFGDPQAQPLHQLLWPESPIRLVGCDN